MGQNLDMIRSGFETAFINGNLASNAEYKPSFVSNRPEAGKKVISSIEDELLRCEEFKISVAFVTMGGITPLLLALKELEKKGVTGKIMKTIEVVAAIIVKGNKVFATQRGYGEFKDGWEFPGGKIEPGESPEEALIREIREELDVDIKVGKLLETVEYDYPKFHLTMHCFMCELLSEEIVLKEHEDAKWLEEDELDTVEWLPADVGLISKIFA